MLLGGMTRSVIDVRAHRHCPTAGRCWRRTRKPESVPCRRNQTLGVTQHYGLSANALPRRESGGPCSERWGGVAVCGTRPTIGCKVIEYTGRFVAMGA